MTDASHPVSAYLEQRLKAQLNQHKIVLWLDADGRYSAFVDGLARRAAAKDFPAPVFPFRGSFLELMLALETEGSTIDKPPMLFHVPGFNTTSIRKTPLLEMFEASRPWQVGLPTLVSEAANGRLPLPEIEAFLKQGEPTLEAADAWLSQATSSGQDTHAEWITGLSAPELVDHLVTTRTPPGENVRRALCARAEVLFGMTPDWVDWLQEELPEAVATWLQCVEFVHDLRRPPRHARLLPLARLPVPTVKRCQTEAARLRTQHPDRYKGWARGMEARLNGEELTSAKDLGKIDTFLFESLTIYSSAVEALTQGDYPQALEWALAQEVSLGFWNRDDQARRWAWALVGEAARLGVALQQSARPLAGAQSLEEAADRYAQDASQVDRAHRRFEQRWAALYGPLLPELARLDQAFEKLRFAWADWAGHLARDFTRLCRDTGLLPPPELQQRTLFDQVVQPLLADGERVALFVLDALRFEMALELRDELASAGGHLELRPRLAELPTITAVGMNALAPIARAGRLSPVVRDGRFLGFRSGESQVLRPADRQKAITQRVLGRTPLFLTLEEVQQTSASKLKHQVAQTQLVVVHSLELDESGEAGFGVRMFENILRDVLAARHQLEQAGVQHFVFTSDHGFVLQRGAGSPQQFGAPGEADRRYVYSRQDRPEAGHLSVSLASLGYEDEPGYLVFREDLLEFRAGGTPGSFTHGGNSLQERVIPVLTLTRKRPVAATSERWVLHCEPAQQVKGAQHVRLKVSPARDAGQAPLEFARSRWVDVGVRLKDATLGVEVLLKEVAGPNASAQGTVLRLDAASGEWTDLYFVLQGTVEERQRVEFFVAAQPEAKVSPAVAYPVLYSGTTQVVRPQEPPPEAVAAGAALRVTLRLQEQESWVQRLGDPDAGKVFDHLEA
ncbi:MAG: BREX-6 system phosphatase PglZ, partial [Myxococcota bacterium]|nr:BREX-6 system phosphatase PglZ [Myxococcota bacterium]